jgi:hypothetical protein
MASPIVPLTQRRGSEQCKALPRAKNSRDKDKSTRVAVTQVGIPFKTAYRWQSLTALSEDEIREMVAAH